MPLQLFLNFSFFCGIISQSTLIAVLRFAVHCNYAHLACELSATIWPLELQDPITPLAFIFSNWVALVTAVRPNLQKTAVMELFKDVEAPFTHLFTKVLVKGMSSGLIQCGWAGLNWLISSNITISLELWIPSSPIFLIKERGMQSLYWISIRVISTLWVIPICSRLHYFFYGVICQFICSSTCFFEWCITCFFTTTAYNFFVCLFLAFCIFYSFVFLYVSLYVSWPTLQFINLLISFI